MPIYSKNPMKSYLLFLILGFLLKIIQGNTTHKKLNSTKKDPITDLRALILMQDKETLQMKVSWKTDSSIDSRFDVVVTPNGDLCTTHTVCTAYDLASNMTEIFLPENPNDAVAEHQKCSIQPGCEYNVRVVSVHQQFSKNITVKIPDCINGLCSCHYENLLPVPKISAQFILQNTISADWFLENTSGSMEFPKKLYNTSLTNICISVGRNSNPTLPWGGKYSVLSHSCERINPVVFIYNMSHAVRGHNNFVMNTTFEQGASIELRAAAVDSRNCWSVDGKYSLRVPVSKNESRQENSTKESNKLFLFSIIAPIVFIVSMTLCIAHFYIRRIKKRKEDTVANWRSIYHNVPQSAIRPISMEENLLYTDKDILEAQKIGKADVFEIPQTSIIIGCEIGKGAFGRVFKAIVQNLYRQPGGTIVAVKQLKKRPSSDEVEEFLGEIQTMKNVGRHDNVVSLLGCCTIKEPLMMVMEYVGNGDLLQYLRNVRRKHLAVSRSSISGGAVGRLNPSDSQQSFHVNTHLLPKGKYLELRLSSTSTLLDGSNTHNTDDETYQSPTPSVLRPSVTETMYTMLSTNSQDSGCSNGNAKAPELDYVLDNTELQNFAIQIARGMRHLEEKGITHRDLAARNVLIDERKVLKISDFGLSRPGIYVNTHNKKLPLRWLSIEAIRDHLYSSKSDVWAFAIVLWEIGTLGGFPYPTISNHELLPFLASNKRLERPEICTEELYKLMLNCWAEDPNGRPSFEEILRRLQPQNQRIYVDFNSLGPEYVFPPTREQVLDNNSTKSQSSSAPIIK